MSRGRKRKPGRREPNGRESRRKLDVALRTIETEAEVKRVAIDARKRQFPDIPDAWLDLVDSTKPTVGTTHGVMCLQGAINIDQWSAAEWYLRARKAHLSAILAPGREGGSREGPNHACDDGSGYVAFCAESEATWALVRECLQDASTQARSPIIAAFEVILENGHTMSHMNGDLRLGLNAIFRTFFTKRRKAA